MALVKCPKCGKDISDKAITCVHCGYDKSVQSTDNKDKTSSKKRLICEMCGGSSLIKEDGVFICHNCGCRYSVEEAKKMMVELSGDTSDQSLAKSFNNNTVERDTVSGRLSNLYTLARRAKDDNNTENAQKYYEQIVIDDPDSWEANFYTTYYQSINCKIADIYKVANQLKNCEATVLGLIKKTISDDDEQKKALMEIKDRLIYAANLLSGAAISHYDGIGYQIRANYTQEMIYNCAAARDIMYTFGDSIVDSFGDRYSKNISVPCWVVGISIHMNIYKHLQNKELNRDEIMGYVNKIRKYDSNYQAPDFNSQSQGCYIATSVYGSYDCPEVWTLRRYRDFSLAKTWYGRLFIYMYYAISPTLVKYFGKKKWFRKRWRNKLDRKIIKLQKKGFESTPYEDRSW